MLLPCRENGDVENDRAYWRCVGSSREKGVLTMLRQGNDEAMAADGLIMHMQPPLYNINKLYIPRTYWLALVYCWWKSCWLPCSREPIFQYSNAKPPPPTICRKCVYATALIYFVKCHMFQLHIPHRHPVKTHGHIHHTHSTHGTLCECYKMQMNEATAEACARSDLCKIGVFRIVCF